MRPKGELALLTSVRSGAAPPAGTRDAASAAAVRAATSAAVGFCTLLMRYHFMRYHLPCVARRRSARGRGGHGLAQHRHECSTANVAGVLGWARAVHDRRR